MRAVIAWLPLDVRRRARSLLALTMLLGLAGTLVLAVSAGARRDGSALQRLRADSLPASALVLPNTPGFDWDEVRALPNVEAVGEFPVGSAFGVEGIGAENIGFPTASPEAYRDLERGVVLEGRRMDNSKVDEAFANEAFMRKYHLKVGDTLTARMFTTRQLKAAGSEENPPNAGDAKGPSQTLRVVGCPPGPVVVRGR